MPCFRKTTVLCRSRSVRRTKEKALAHIFYTSGPLITRASVNSMVQMTSMFVGVFGFPSGGVEKLLVYSYLDTGLSKLWKGRRKFGKDVWQQFGSSGI